MSSTEGTTRRRAGRLPRLGAALAVTACLLVAGCGGESRPAEAPAPPSDAEAMRRAVDRFVEVRATGDAARMTALMTEEARGEWAERDFVTVATAYTVEDVVASGGTATATVTWAVVRKEWSTGEVEGTEAAHTELIEFTWTEKDGWLVSRCPDGVTVLE